MTRRSFMRIAAGACAALGLPVVACATAIPGMRHTRTFLKVSPPDFFARNEPPAMTDIVYHEYTYTLKQRMTDDGMVSTNGAPMTVSR